MFFYCQSKIPMNCVAQMTTNSPYFLQLAPEGSRLAACFCVPAHHFCWFRSVLIRSGKLCALPIFLLSCRNL
ncbi:hypothetical protein DA391_17090 [Yersinia massiliensis]|uniref:Uncharacterized protein n=1 Tax=Yersinia massiliensis TaxID=419257 RepID=A0ABM6UWN9_9GAMM|nr:hypothetical protein DA391_17090 [Yersinia massiliensis]